MTSRYWQCPPMANPSTTVTQVASCAWIRKNRGDEDPLVDFVPFLVALQELGLGCDLRSRRNEPRYERCGVVDELLHPDEARAIPREPVVDGFDVGGEEAAARVARGLLDLLGRQRLLCVARGLGGQAREQHRARLPEPRVAR